MNKKKEQTIGKIGFWVLLIALILCLVFINTVIKDEVKKGNQTDNIRYKISYIKSYLTNMERNDTLIINFPDVEHIVVDENGYIKNTDLKQPTKGYIKITPDNKFEYKISDNNYCIVKFLNEERERVGNGECNE